ncbi:MAG: phasin family protein [Panacagrimonas sp.]
MAAKDRLEQFKARIDKLGRDSLDVVVNANRIVYQGIQKLADQELKALNDYYKGAVASLKGAKKGSSIKDVATEQLDLMQDTVSKVIAHARESLTIIADTRAELARLVSAGGPLSSKALTQAVEPAQKAMQEVKKRAAKAQKTAVKTAADARKSLEKELAYAEKKGKAAIKKGKAKAKEVTQSVKESVEKGIETVMEVAVPPALKKAVTAKPSPESRAARAASKAKTAARVTPKSDSDAAAGPSDTAVPQSTMPPKKK